MMKNDGLFRYASAMYSFNKLSKSPKFYILLNHVF